MARARNIKPSFFTNELLGESDPLNSLLFIGLWILADREGRLEDRPVRIRASVFPLRPSVDIDSILTWLHHNGFIVRYEVKGKRYIQIENFVKHQQPHYKEVASTIPPVQGRRKVESTSGQRRVNVEPSSADVESTKVLHDPLNPPSLIPDSLQSDSPFLNPETPFPSFADFWSAYPRREGRQAAIKAWAKLNPDAETATKIVADVKLRSKSESWQKDDGKYIPHASTYINGRRWEDEGVKLPTGNNHERTSSLRYRESPAPPSEAG